ncbi:MAG: DUF4976 domain-containing protein [Planctomycetaceae bacterium]
MNNASIPKWEGVRGERYVYARYFQQEPIVEFLHDLEHDPDQLVNLADDAGHAETLEAMRGRMRELREGYGGEYSDDKFPAARRR